MVEALAAATGASPVALEPPLYEAVDPDALDALYETDPCPTVEFEYAGRTVVVRGEGTVAVEITRNGIHR